MLCQRSRSCTLNICSQRRRVYCFYCVHFPLVVWVFVFFVYVNISLQQSTCIMFSSYVVGFALFCCFLIVVYLIIFLTIVWVSDFFVFLNILLQQSTCNLKMDNSL
jgi:hypothetical protein